MAGVKQTAKMGFRRAIKWVRAQEPKDKKEQREVLDFLCFQAARETGVDVITEKMIKTNKYICPECSGGVLTRSRYCNHCGQKLSWKIPKGGGRNDLGD